MKKVRVVKDYSGSGAYGSRVKNERFEYDTDKDPAGLLKLGLVALVEEPKEPKAK
jgi:hypothetical protein